MSLSSSLISAALKTNCVLVLFHTPPTFVKVSNKNQVLFLPSFIYCSVTSCRNSQNLSLLTVSKVLRFRTTPLLTSGTITSTQSRLNLSAPWGLPHCQKLMVWPNFWHFPIEPNSWLLALVGEGTYPSIQVAMLPPEEYAKF